AAGNKEYCPTQYSGSFIVNGASITINVKFALVTYSIIFKESGLPSGTQWSVTLNGVIHNSTTNMIIFSEPNGSYSYTITTPINGSTGIRYVTLIPSGTTIVNGANATIDVSYETQYYLTMLASPENGGSVSPTDGWYNAGSSVTINAIPNSNYEFVSWTGTGNGSYSGTSTQVTITMNAPITEQAYFIELFKVTLIENGLPSGTTWYVNLSNGQSYSSSTNTITFNEPNGTYSYTMAAGNKEYCPTQYSGSFIVNGASITI
ncbi:MAG: InlB B-repeat-containing protein, partial [Thermoplasmata archaeon]